MLAPGMDIHTPIVIQFHLVLAAIRYERRVGLGYVGTLQFEQLVDTGDTDGGIVLSKVAMAIGRQKFLEHYRQEDFDVNPEGEMNSDESSDDDPFPDYEEMLQHMNRPPRTKHKSCLLYTSPSPRD